MLAHRLLDTSWTLGWKEAVWEFDKHTADSIHDAYMYPSIPGFGHDRPLLQEMMLGYTLRFLRGALLKSVFCDWLVNRSLGHAHFGSGNSAVNTLKGPKKYIDKERVEMPTRSEVFFNLFYLPNHFLIKLSGLNCLPFQSNAWLGLRRNYLRLAHNANVAVGRATGIGIHNWAYHPCPPTVKPEEAANIRGDGCFCVNVGAGLCCPNSIANRGSYISREATPGSGRGSLR